MTGYDVEETFWKNVHDEKDAMMKIVWGAQNLEEFNKRTEFESNFIKEQLNIVKEDIVLDYGAGMGRLVKAIAPLCCSIVGLDVSNAMVCHSKKYLSDTKNGEVIPCSTLGLSNVKEACIDKIYSHIVLQHINKYKVLFILQHLKRYLAPGGTGLFQFPDLLKTDKEFMQYADVFVNNEENNCSLHFWTQEEAKKIFELAGWKVVEVIEWEKDFWVKAE